jgi:predicted membrane protein
MLTYICSSMKTKVTFYLIFFLLFTVAGILVAASYSLFTASSVGDKIVLQWITTNEDNLEKFGVERKGVNDQDFATINYVSARGYASTYVYEDKNIYKTTGDIYVYRLAFYDKNNPNPHHSDLASVSHDLSSVKRTWGSIKAMFR